MKDHVHMLLRIPPKYAVSQVVGYIKRKSAIHLARVYGERKRNFVGPPNGGSKWWQRVSAATSRFERLTFFKARGFAGALLLTGGGKIGLE